MHLLVQLPITLLNEVLHDFNPRNNHFLKDALSMIHLNHVSLLVLAWWEIEFLKNSIWMLVVSWSRWAISSISRAFHWAETLKVVIHSLVHPLLLKARLCRPWSLSCRHEFLSCGFVVGSVSTATVTPSCRLWGIVEHLLQRVDLWLFLKLARGPALVSRRSRRTVQLTWINQIVLVRCCNKSTSQVLTGCALQVITVVVTYVEAKTAGFTTSVDASKNVISALIFDTAGKANASLEHGWGARIELSKYPRV